MKVQTVSIDMEAFGATFAGLDSVEQALFFKGLAGELACWDSVYRAQMQFHRVAEGLTGTQKDLLEDTVGMVWFKERVK